MHRRARATSLPFLAVLTGLVVTGLTGCADDGGLPDLGELAAQVEEEVRKAGAQIDDARRTVEEAGLDAETRADVENAVGQAAAALEQARAATEQGVESAGPEAQAAVDRARASLEDAEARLDEVAADVDGSVRPALEGLADEVRDLASRLDDA